MSPEPICPRSTCSLILMQWGHTGPHTSWLSSTGTWVLPFVPKSVCAEALSWSHHPEVSLGQECGTGSMYVPTVSKQTRRTCLEPWLRGVRQACLRSIPKNAVLHWQCLPGQQPLDVSGMGTLEEQAACRPPAQLRKRQGAGRILTFGGYSPWPGGWEVV